MAAELEQLLFHEAHLLDTGRYAEWLELLAPDLRYWAPARSETPRAQEAAEEPERLLLFDETKASLSLRIKRLGTGLAWSESPPTRTRRFVSNVVVGAAVDGLVPVRSYLLLFKSRGFTEERLLVGSREDRWQRAERWLLKERKVGPPSLALANLRAGVIA
jgi:3-phenylpropionate/cinnamic acid dioxygenase small subunit